MKVINNILPKKNRVIKCKKKNMQRLKVVYKEKTKD